MCIITFLTEYTNINRGSTKKSEIPTTYSEWFCDGQQGVCGRTTTYTVWPNNI